ncbi:Uncharacterized protein SCF082_LOCUS43115 [Durusdinium trenchii]|uniref:Uncharacterized protein n=1 Tax=Durusdinium trenchii TaxID=1381693 RepID=A0ABP0QT99_9DINO
MHWRQQSVTSYLALQPRRLTKHEESEVHRRAACKHVPDLDEALAPTSKQFKDLLQHIRTAPIGTSGISTVGGQKKCRKLLWCLAESHREAKRGLFDPGMGADQRKVIHSTTLFQDARAGRLSLRFTTASSKLVREEGFLAPPIWVSLDWTLLIQYSEAFKAWFASAIKRIDPDVSAVSAKKGMLDLGFERRGQQEGKSAAQFCGWLDLEKSVQFAMMADCANENLLLIRLLDYQGFPIDELPSYLMTFKDRIRALFTGPTPACLSSGCCGHMLKVLRHSLSLAVPGQSNLVLGGGHVPDDVLQRCLKRMQNWIVLVENTIDAEFPHYEVLQAFGAFNLSLGVRSVFVPSVDCFKPLGYLIPSAVKPTNSFCSFGTCPNGLWATRGSHLCKLGCKQRAELLGPTTKSTLVLSCHCWCTILQLVGVRVGWSNPSLLAKNFMITSSFCPM